MSVEVNRIWSVLAKGVVGHHPEFCRRVDPQLYVANSDYDRILDVLVPHADQLLRYFKIEQLTQLLLSTMPTQAADFDPVNTYAAAALTYPTPGAKAIGSPMQVYFYVDDAEIRAGGDGWLQFECTVNPGTMTVATVHGSSSFTFAEGLSSLIQLFPGFSIRLGGTLPGGLFRFTAEYVVTLVSEWQTTMVALALLPDIQWYDGDSRQIWLADPLWTDRLAALTLSTVKGLSRWPTP